MFARLIDRLRDRSQRWAIQRVLDGVLSGERPPGVPHNWIRTPTQTGVGFRWDDPDNPGNSVRFFRGDPTDPNPSHHQAFVIELRDGQVVDEQGLVVNDEAVVAHALKHT
jgi:hypothetical protein